MKKILLLVETTHFRRSYSFLLETITFSEYNLFLNGNNSLYWKPLIYVEATPFSVYHSL